MKCPWWTYHDGASEIDMVVNIGKMLGGDWHYVSAEIKDLWNWQSHCGNPMLVDGFDARDPIAMKTRQPNILFFLPDQHRPDWLGCNPELPLRTPNLDRLCGHGIRFTNAFTPSPLCSPARACLATGRDYHRCGVRNRQNTPLSLPNYYRCLRDSGYEVAGVGKFDLHKPDHDWGLDGSKSRGEFRGTA